MELLVKVVSSYINDFDFINFMTVIWNELGIFQAFGFHNGLIDYRMIVKMQLCERFFFNQLNFTSHIMLVISVS